LNKAFGDLKYRPPHDIFDEVNAIIASPTFQQLDLQKRDSALIQAAILATRVGESPAGLHFLTDATDADPTNQMLWGMRLALAHQLKSPDAAISLTKIAQTWPATLRVVSDEIVEDVVDTAHKGGSSQELTLLEALYAARWAPSDPLTTASAQWRDLVLLLIKKGETDRALAVAHDISDPDILISLHADRRADGLIKAAPQLFDVDKAAKAQLEDLSRRAQADSGRLEIVNGEVAALLKLNRAADALALSDQILKRIDDKAQADTLADFSSEAPWTHTYRAYALLALGHEEQGIHELQTAIHAGGGEDLSATINLADALYESGRSDEALKVIGALQEAGGETQAQIEQVKVCAYTQKGERANADVALDYLRDHERESFDALASALLCENDQAALAKLYIKRLGDEALRADTLLAMQRYVSAPARPPFRQITDARRAAVFQRPDVTAALEAVGHRLSWPMKFDTYFGP
jgi:hypothetical protein